MLGCARARLSAGKVNKLSSFQLAIKADCLARSQASDPIAPMDPSKPDGARPSSAGEKLRLRLAQISLGLSLSRWCANCGAQLVGLSLLSLGRPLSVGINFDLIAISEISAARRRLCAATVSWSLAPVWRTNEVKWVEIVVPRRVCVFTDLLIALCSSLAARRS